MGRGLAAGLSLEKTLKYFNCWWSTLFKPQFSSHRSFSRSQTACLHKKKWGCLHHSHSWEPRWGKSERETEWVSALCLCLNFTSLPVLIHYNLLCVWLVNLQRLWNAKRRLRLWVVVKMWWGFCLKVASFFVWIKLALLSVPGEVKDLQLQFLRDRPSISS